MALVHPRYEIKGILSRGTLAEATLETPYS